MRKSRVTALVIAALVSTASFAQAQSSAPNAPAERHGMGGGMMGRGGRDRGLMKGLKLSDAEKAQLKSIHGKYAAEAKPLREALKPAMVDARAARQKGDTAGARAILQRNKGSVDQLKALHDREKTEIRAALSPENQKLFDANAQQMAQRRADWEKNGHKGRGRGKGATG
ncbi:MAG: hypothetical protein JWN53_1575 [Gemmatimonadetes bacterium]|jgi:Spy/CpxP family protein refolding chaperone|nr:hypothetical protein [Gemmatimonadota bacterium]